MDDLERLFSAYREVLPDQEPSPAFTPGMWRKIEARRSPVRLLRRMAEAFVTLAAVLTIVLGTFLIPKIQTAPVYSANYIDILADEQAEAQQFAEIVRPDLLREAPNR